MDLVYLDNNATTRPAPPVVEAMLPFLTETYGNPSSVHRFGQTARKAVDEARGQLASLLHCLESELLFTSGGTESINSAIRGILNARSPRKKIITSSVEHSATREFCAQLAKEGYEVITLAVDRDGSLDLEALKQAITLDPAIVSIMWANNETGVVFPVETISEICKAARVPFHCDATQAIGKVPVDFKAVGIDAASFSGHKFHGPKGVGGLYLRRGLRTHPLIVGGPQERGRRGGTENVPGIVGMGKAAELAIDALKEMPRVSDLRDQLEKSILETIPDTHINGRPRQRVPNTTNIGFSRLEAEAILLLLSEKGICASAGAACSSGSLEPSPILLAMGIDPKIAHGAIRFSLSKYTNTKEIEFVLGVLPAIIQRLRSVLPVNV